MSARPRLLFLSRAVNPHGGIPRAAFETLKALEGSADLALAAIDCDAEAAGFSSWIPVPKGRARSHFGELAGFLRRTRAVPRDGFGLSIGVLGECLDSDVAWAHFCYPAWRDVALPVTPSGRARWARRLNPAGLLQWHAERRHAARARAVVAVSEGLRQELVRHYGLAPGSVRVIENGVDAGAFTPAGRAVDRAALARKFGLPGDAPWILFVASYDLAWKGLAPAMEGLARAGGTARLLVAGGQDPLGHFRRLAETLGIAARVHWLGRQDGMQALYRSCDVYLAPSAWEAMSLAALEAAASALPILATRVSGMTEILADGENGFFVARDADDIGRRVAELAGSPELRARMGAASRERAARFTWKAAAGKWLALAEELAATR